MDTELDMEAQHRQISQLALQQISSSSVDESTECCVICLGDLVEQCEARPCQHNHFDFVCLVTWLEQRAACPLCGRDICEVRYGLSEDGTQGKVYKVPESFRVPDKPNAHAEDGFSRHAHSSNHQNSGASDRSTNGRLPHDDEAIQRRRLVYRHNLYSRHVGSNLRQPAQARHSELSPQLFMTDHRLVSRARAWLRRELRVFRYLYSPNELPHEHEHVSRRRPNRAVFLRECVIAMLKTIDIQSSTGGAENLIQEYLGRDDARLFLHELKAWLRSPYESLSEWDRHVQYTGGHALPGASQSESTENHHIVLKYNEPAEARKPPPSQAWRMYVFEGDDVLQVVELWERSAWLLGRDERVVDMVIPHSSCSSQHAALQFRHTVNDEEGKPEATRVQDKGCVRLYLFDLDSTNGTHLNGERIESNCYVQVRHKDVIELGGCKREYVMILPPKQ